MSADTLAAAQMTNDLASLIGRQQKRLDTQDFLDKSDSNLTSAMGLSKAA